ncbi:unnamed protein product [Prorocentrum cordatum]|uniref:Uncharacterized protein n=1 Tax=Prorocentrum cordatum TaxID=2364126 RepID=A0ABN9TSN4_9DINO|nr:unnamed protein product [Polarella glacialis]
MPVTYKDESYNEVMTWTENTEIQYAANKKSGKSFERYGKYMKAKTVGESLSLGSLGADLLFDFEKGLLWRTGGPTRERPPEVKGVDRDEVKSWNKTDQQLGKMYEKWKSWSATFAALEESGLTREELKAANDEQDVECGTDSMLIAIGRRKAQERAREILKAADQQGGRPVTDDELLSCLRLWAFKENTNRTNVTPEGETFVYSDTIGLIKMSTCEKTLLTAGTKRYEEFTMLINRWFKDRMPNELKGSFGYTSININKNYAGRLHRDGNNQGPSMIKAFGEFVGGELNYWPHDDKKLPLEEFDDSKKITMNIQDNIMLFDGNRGHCVNDFHGERYTLVFFSIRTWNKVPAEDLKEALRCGIPVPTQELMPKMQALLGPGPAGYRVWEQRPDGAAPEAPAAAAARAPPAAATATTARAHQQALLTPRASRGRLRCRGARRSALSGLGGGGLRGGGARRGRARPRCRGGRGGDRGRVRGRGRPRGGRGHQGVPGGGRRAPCGARPRAVAGGRRGGRRAGHRDRREGVRWGGPRAERCAGSGDGGGAPRRRGDRPGGHPAERRRGSGDGGRAPHRRGLGRRSRASRQGGGRGGGAAAGRGGAGRAPHASRGRPLGVGLRRRGPLGRRRGGAERGRAGGAGRRKGARPDRGGRVGLPGAPEGRRDGGGLQEESHRAPEPRREARPDTGGHAQGHFDKTTSKGKGAAGSNGRQGDAHPARTRPGARRGRHLRAEAGDPPEAGGPGPQRPRRGRQGAARGAGAGTRAQRRHGYDRQLRREAPPMGGGARRRPRYEAPAEGQPV